MPVNLTEGELRELVVDALDSIPPDLGRLIDNVVVQIEERSPEDPDLLGVYSGFDLTERGPISYGDGLELPDQIVIFRCPHLELAEDLDDLADLVTETVVHEIAHHFGIDDDRLDDLGWS